MNDAPLRLGLLNARGFARLTQNALQTAARYGWSLGRRAARGATTAALDLAFPPTCSVCRQSLKSTTAPLVCSDCRIRLLGPATPRCGRCAAHVVAPSLAADGCHLCRAARLKFDAAVTLGNYDDDLRHAVLRSKLVQNEPLSLALGQMLAAHQSAEMSAWMPDVVVPVPMHWRRRLWRATNGPDLMASAVARRLQVRCLPQGVIRRRPTQPQASVTVAERRKNVRGAFAVNGAYDWSGARVLIIDDILTTGATCSEIASELKQAGAEAVFVAIAARAQGKL